MGVVCNLEPSTITCQVVAIQLYSFLRNVLKMDILRENNFLGCVKHFKNGEV